MPLGDWALLAFKVAAVVFLWVWLARASSRLTALALGLIIGGAVGNAIDRLHWPGVMDFVLFHIETATWSFRWYVFNLADAGHRCRGRRTVVQFAVEPGRRKSALIMDKRTVRGSAVSYFG